MVSLFGMVSAVVAAVSIATLILHFRLMQRRGAVDEALAAANELLHPAGPVDPGDVKAAVAAYNSAVQAYNVYISAFPGKIMAAIVGFKKEPFIEEPF